MLNSRLKPYKHHIKSTGWYLGSSLLVAMIGIAINPLMAKNLSPDDYAIIGYFTSFNMLLLPIMHLSLMTFFLRKFFSIAEQDRQRVSNTILIALTFIGLIVLILFTTLFYLFCKSTDVQFPFFPYAIITFAQIYVGLFATFYLTKLRINRQAKRFGVITLINSTITVLFSLLFVVVYKFGADGKLWAMLLGSIIMAVYSFQKALTKWEFDWSVLKEALKFGLPLTISAIFWYFLSGVDRAMLAELNDTYTFGIYSVGIQISSYLLIFYTSVANTFDPDIYKAVAEGKLRKMFLIMAGIVVVVAVANGLFILFAPYVISLLTAGRYVNSAPFAQILSLHNITMAVYYMVVRVLVAHGYVKTELTVRIIGASLAVVMFRLLIDNFGFYGAAWGQVFSFLLLSLLGLVAFFIVHKNSQNGRHIKIG